MSASSKLGRAAGIGPTQDTRLFQLHTPLGPDRLIGEELQVWECVGPRPGPALGDEAPGWDGDWAPWALDASLGPARAGLRLVVLALSTDARLDIESLIGQPALVELLCQDSVRELRPWHGHVVSAARLGSDGGLARYRLVVEPWLAFLALRSDAWVFQDRTVREIVDAVFSRRLDGGRLAPAWRWELRDAGAYARRSLCVQHHDSDLDFVQRLLLEEGLFCWWEHEGGRDAPALGRHTLVIADHPGAFAPNRQPRVRFTGSDAPLGADSLTRWRDGAGVAPARVGLLSRDHRSLEPRPVGAAVGTAPALPELAHSDAPGPYAYEDLAQGRRLAARQAETLDAARGLSHGRGPWRRAQAGTVFTLAEHPRHDGSDAARDTFVVLAAQHRTRNNLHADARARLPTLDEVLAPVRQGESEEASQEREEAPLHEVALLAQPLARPVRLGAPRPASHGDGAMGLLPRHDAQSTPALDAWTEELLTDPPPLRALPLPDVRLNRAPTAAGVQTALVTGQGAPVHTDRDARVRLQFHWQRGRGGSHRLPHPGGGCNAPATAASSTWVRVGQSHAGVNHGAVFIPRVGQEVLVGFIGGDAERPVVLGSLYNGQGQSDAPGNRIHSGVAHATPCAPPWFPGSARSGAHQGHQHAAVLSGHRSQSLNASATGLGGWSQLVFDDSPGANRIEAATSQAHTRLQLGALLQQQGNERLAPRGHGLSLDSAAHGALRAGAGLLLSAHGQGASTGAGQQMDSRAPLQVLRQAQERLHALAESAQAHGARLADEPAVAGARPDQGTRQLPIEQGLHALTTSLEATASNTGGDSGPGAHSGGRGTVAAWQRPELVLAAPAGLGLFTPASAIFSAGANAGFVAGQDVNVVAQGPFALAARSGVVLYTYGTAASPDKPNTETGIALHAAAGSVHASANTGAARLAASGAVEVASTQGSVEVGSPLSVLLAAAGAALKIGPGDIEVSAPGSVRFRAGMKDLTGPAAVSAPSPYLAAPPEIHLNPQEPYSLRFAVQGADDLAAEASLCGLPYTAYTADGAVVADGVIPADGRLPRIDTENCEPVMLEIGAADGACLVPIANPLPDDEPPGITAADSNDSAEVDEETVPDTDDEPASKYQRDLEAAQEQQYGEFLPESLIAALLEDPENTGHHATGQQS